MTTDPSIALAASLDERFDAYVVAWKELQECMGILQRLGLSTNDQEDALNAADREVAHVIDEDGRFVPNYLGATALLEEARDAAHKLIGRARVASREIFLATVAIEALSAPRVAPMHDALSMCLERMVEQASHELALGHLSTARKIASAAGARADAALARTLGARERLSDTTLVLGDLRADGRAADRLRMKVESAREALSEGLVDGTAMAEVARRVSMDVAAFAARYERSRRLLANSEQVYARLQRDGSRSDDVEAILADARRALDAGDWARVEEQVALAAQVLVQLRDTRSVLALAITEVVERAALLKDGPAVPISEVQEMMARAQDEVRNGRLQDASQDVLRANELINQAM